MMEATIPESLFDELKEQVFETEDVVSEEKDWLKESHKTKEKKKQVVEKQAKVKPTLTSREKTRVGKLSNSIFDGANSRLKKVQEANNFRNKMRSQANWNIKQKTEQVKEMAKDAVWEAFKKAVKVFLVVGALFLVWKSGIFEKLSFTNIKQTVLRVSKWFAANVPPLIKELPSKLTKLALNMVKSVQQDGGQSIISSLGGILMQLGETFMTRVFPEIIKRFAFWLDLANFAMGVVTWATTGATIGYIIPGVGTAVGAVVGAAIGLVVGFWDLAKKKIEDDNYSKAQTQELAKKASSKKMVADETEEKINSLLAQAEYRKNQGIKVSPEEISELQNHLAVLQEVREKQSQLASQLNLYRWYFTTNEQNVLYTEVAKTLMMFGIDPTKMIESQQIDGTTYIRKFNGVEFSADNPSAIFNAVKRVLENHLIQRTAGTVLEGKDAKEISMMLYNYKNGKENLLSPEEQTAIKHLIEGLPHGDISKEQSKITAAMFNEDFTKDKTADEKAQKAIDALTQRAKDIGFKTQEEIEEEEKQRKKEYEEIMEKKNIVVSFTNPDKSVFDSLIAFMTPDLSPIKDFFLNMGEVFGDALSVFVKEISSTKTNTKFSEEDKSFLQEGENRMLNVVSVLIPDTQEYRNMFQTLRSVFTKANAKLKYGVMENQITSMITDYLIRKGVYVTTKTHASGNTITLDQAVEVREAMRILQLMFGKDYKKPTTEDAGKHLSELIKHETDESSKKIKGWINSKEKAEDKLKYTNIEYDRQKRLSKAKESLDKWSEEREKHKEEMEAKEERKFNPKYDVITPYSAQIVKNHTSEEISRTFSQTNTESNNGEGAIQTIR